MELIKQKVTFTSKKDNLEHTCYNYYLVLDEKLGVKVQIKPQYYPDMQLLKLFATENF